MHELAGKMNMQPGDRWIGTVHAEPIYTPSSLRCRDVATVDKINDLVDLSRAITGLDSILVRLLNHDCGSIVALVDVLEQILDRRRRRAALDIGVRAVLCHQIEVMRNNPTVVENPSTIDPDRPSIVAAPVLRVAIRTVCSVFEERLGIAFLNIHRLSCRVTPYLPLRLGHGA